VDVDGDVGSSEDGRYRTVLETECAISFSRNGASIATTRSSSNEFNSGPSIG